MSRDKEAYLEVLHYLEQCYPGYSADFAFNPGNYLLKELLDLRKAEYEPEQQKMVLGTAVLGIDTTGVELLSAQYTEQYCAIHNKDMYWTGEKVVQKAAPRLLCQRQAQGFPAPSSVAPVRTLRYEDPAVPSKDNFRG